MKFKIGDHVLRNHPRVNMNIGHKRIVRHVFELEGIEYVVYQDQAMRSHGYPILKPASELTLAPPEPLKVGDVVKVGEGGYYKYTIKCIFTDKSGATRAAIESHDTIGIYIPNVDTLVRA